jgi:VDE lipocalin domain
LIEFWENWYIIGENSPGDEEFKFVYYNGKTRQNTYSGAFIYSRSKELSSESLQKVYEIAKTAGMDPNQFCRIRNGCFVDEPSTLPNSMLEQEQGPTSNSRSEDFFRGMIASTRISEMLGVEPVEARDYIRRVLPTAPELTPVQQQQSSLLQLSLSPILSQKEQQQQVQQRPWWNEVGDYLENPHRHFQAMDDLRAPMIWPDNVAKNR